MDNENLAFVLEKFSDDVQYTFTGIQHNHSLIVDYVDNSYAPATFLQSNMVPIPKGARANVTDSNMYRSIAISSIMSKILDNVIIEQQQVSLATSSYQFGFKSKVSTVLCTTMMVETIQYYLEKGDHSVVGCC